MQTHAMHGEFTSIYIKPMSLGLSAKEIVSPK